MTPDKHTGKEKRKKGKEWQMQLRTQNLEQGQGQEQNLIADLQFEMGCARWRGTKEGRKEN
jgi:hypothetical protein